MKTRYRRTSKSVTQLADPDPSFVSLVSRGANQTPFRVIKSDDVEYPTIVKPMKPKHRVNKSEEVLDSAIQAILFSKGVFKTEEDVKSYLDENGFESAEILSEDDKFVVKSEGDELENDTLDALTAIEAEDGVTILVGKEDDLSKVAPTATATATDDDAPSADHNSLEEISDADLIEDNEELEPVAKTADVVRKKQPKPKTDVVPFALELGGVSSNVIAKKIDYYAAMASGGTTIAQILKDGNDGVPIGYYDLMEAFGIALKQATTNGDTEAITSLGKEFSKLMNSLIGLTDKITKMENRDEQIELLFAKPEANAKPEVDEDSIVAKITSKLKSDMDDLRKEIDEQCRVIKEQKERLDKSPVSSRKSLEVDDTFYDEDEDSYESRYNGMTKEEKERAKKIDDRLAANALGRRRITQEDDVVFYRN